MKSAAFMDALIALIGEDDASRCARRFGPLEQTLHDNSEILNYEALAFYVYSTGMGWYERINTELWSGAPSVETMVFSAALNQGLGRLPAYTANGGVVYRGLRTDDLAGFLKRYGIGGVLRFPAFTSASLHEELAFGGNILFIIRSLTARVVWFLAADFREHEVLMPTECSFRVISVDTASRRAVIVLQELV